MLSLNLINMALGAAIALSPLDNAIHLKDGKQIIAQQKVEMKQELREAIRVFDTLLSTLTLILQEENDILQRLGYNFTLMMEQTESLLANLMLSFKSQRDVNILQSLQTTVTQFQQLYRAISYKQKADQVLLSRLYQEGQVGLVFDGSLSREEKRRLLLAKRRN